jgi:predicted AlkP superfamily pyrophosphatase or phosphodiesterase
MKRLLVIILASAALVSSCSRSSKEVKRPKIVIGLVVDQMRWDYLYRYYDRYSNAGFKRLINNGFECRQTYINYLPSFTAPGHACVYTGSVPSLHGIAGNDWTDNLTGAHTYCVADTSVRITGDAEGAPMSPANLLTTTVTDELRLATNFRSRVYGVALKDRSSILPAGHLANGAYWYNEKTGNFVSSSYYKNSNPAWLQEFNKKKEGDRLVKEGWNLLYAADTYVQSTADSNGYEAPFKWEKSPVFPRRFDTLKADARYGLVKTIPAGNTFTLMMAKACIEGEDLGKKDATDFLAISLSATDYVGHRFAPNSIEMEDTYLRLDKEIAELLEYLDRRYGRNNYLFFLTADHGGAHNQQFLTDNHVPAGVEHDAEAASLNASIKQAFGIDSLITFTDNYQITMNDSLIATSHFDRETIRVSVMEWLRDMPEVAYVIDMEHMDRTPVPEPLRTMAVNGYNRNRSGSIQVVPKPGWYENGGRFTGTTHGTWNPYDTHIPLLWFGWNVAKGATAQRYDMTDIAPTIADMLRIQVPNGCIGKTIPGVAKK